MTRGSATTRSITSWALRRWLQHRRRGCGNRRADQDHGPRIRGAFRIVSLSNNLSSFGNATASPFTINDKYYQGIDNFSWIIGKHSLRMGGEYRYNEFPQVGNEFPRGQFFFPGNYTQVNSVTNAQSGGYSGADFLLGWNTRTDIAAVALARAPITEAASGQVTSTIPGRCVPRTPPSRRCSGLRWASGADSLP